MASTTALTAAPTARTQCDRSVPAFPSLAATTLYGHWVRCSRDAADGATACAECQERERVNRAKRLELEAGFAERAADVQALIERRAAEAARYA